MKKTLALITCLAATALLASLQDSSIPEFGSEPVNSCLDEDCHYDLIGEFRQIADDYRDRDVHAGKGMTCIDCHKISAEHLEEGDPHTATDRPPYPWEQPELCGGCHSDALVMRRFDPAPDLTAEQLFWTSRHGQSLARIRSLVADGEASAEVALSVSGNVATCTSCHGVHGILGVDNPLAPVFSRNIAGACGQCHGDTGVIDTYSESLGNIDPSLSLGDSHIKLMESASGDYEDERNVHRFMLEDQGQLDAPTCNDCHGNHGATPPGALGGSRVAEICGICHVQSYTDYMASPKAGIFSLGEYSDCYACHENHLILRTSDEMVGLQAGSICSRCHGDHGPEAEQIISGINDAISDLKQARHGAEEIVTDAERKGMDVSRGHEKLTELNTALVSARAKIHTFDVEQVLAAAEPGFGIAEEAKQIGEAALQELTFRHIGLGAASLVILFTAVLLALKIRQIDRRQKENKEAK